MTRDEARKLARETYDKLGQGSVYDERAIHAAIVAAHDSALEDAALNFDECARQDHKAGDIEDGMQSKWAAETVRARKIGGGGNG